MRLGLVDEDRLVAVFQESLLVPAIPWSYLSRTPKEVLSLVPARMAAEFRVLPVEVDREGNLTLAMADPTDNRAVDTVAAYTGRFVMRAVAAPSVVRRALLELYGVSLTAAGPVTGPGAEPEPPPTNSNAISAPASPPPAQRPPESVLQALARAVQSGPEPARSARRSRNTQPVPTVPAGDQGDSKAEGKAQRPRAVRRSGKMQTVQGLPPASEAGPTAAGEGNPSDRAKSVPPELEGPVARLRGAQKRDEVVQVLLDHASQQAARVGLFVVQREQLVCLDGRGPDHVVVAMKWFTIPVDQPSPFRDVLTSRSPYIGRLEDTPESSAFRSALGSSEGELLLWPLLVGARAVGVLYADEIQGDLGRLSKELEILSHEAGVAFARIILAQKQNAKAKKEQRRL
ncbi:MAG: hypothetical protein RMK29_20535 [Myxococcales bacterium]|nr:hypothetical protein [Myxococcales bacterium]